MDWSKLFNDDADKPDINSIMKIAQGLTKNLSNEDREVINNLDFHKIVEDVSKSVFQTFNQPPPIEEENADTTNTTKNKRTNDLQFDLDVSLEEMYCGKHKKIIVKRKRSSLQKDGSYKIVEEKKKININVEKGTKDEETFVFQGEADQLPEYETGDIVVTIKETEHPEFTRHGDDLYIMKNIGISEIYYTEFIIKHLDGRLLKIKNDPEDALCYSNGLFRKISNEGMPILESEVNERGDLFIKFNVIFPKQAPDKQKLIELFPPVNTIDETMNSQKDKFIDAPLEKVTDEDFDKMQLANKEDGYSYYEDDDETEDETDDDEDDEEEDEEETCV